METNDMNRDRIRITRPRTSSEEDLNEFDPKNRKKKSKISEHNFEGFDMNMEANANMENIHDENIIIIKPREDQCKKFFADNVKIFRLLQKSVFGEAGILENRKNLKKEVQVVKIKDKNKIETILQITKLGEFDVKCSIPIGRSDNQHIGVIGPIGTETDLDELQEIIKFEGKYQIEKIQRILSFKSKERTPTNLLKIWINADQLPEYMYIMAERFRVKPYIQRTIQCYRCQGFGHFASTCKKSQSCLVCSGNHRFNECPNKNTDNVKCTNCGKNHTANYSKCPMMIKENEIQKIKSIEKVSYKDALVKLNSKEKPNEVPVNHVNVTYPNRSCTNNVSVQSVEMCNASTNTDEIAESTDGMSDKFLAFLLEIICGLSNTQNLEKRCQIVAKSFKFHFDKNYETSDLAKAIKGRINKGGALKSNSKNA